MSSVKDWLNGPRDYATGVALYAAYGTNAALKAAFEQGESEYRKERLLKELRLLKDTVPAIAPVAAEHSTRVFASPVASVVLPEQAVPEEKDPYRAEWLPLYAEMNALRHRLEDANDDIERGGMAHRILELERQCMSVWARRDYWRRTGQHIAPAQPETNAVTDKNMLQKRLNNVRSSVSKYRAKRRSDPQNQKYRVKLQELIAEISYLEKELAK